MQTILAFASIYSIWGSTYLAIKFAIVTVPPFLMAGTRFLIAGVILYVWASSHGAARPSLLNWRSAAIIGTLLLFGGNGMVTWAEQTVPSGLAAVLVATVPLWMALIEALRPNGVRPGKQALAGIGLGFAGMFLLVDQSSFANLGSTVSLLGMLTVIGATFSWASGSLYSRHAPLPSSSQLSTAMEMLAGGSVLILASLATNEWASFDPARVSLVSIVSEGYLVVFGSLVAFTAYIWLLRTTTPARVSTYAYVNPVVAVFLGWSLASETVSAITILGASIIIGSVAVITTSRAPEPDAAEQLVEGANQGPSESI